MSGIACSNGAIYGLASHGRFFGAFKPGNRSRDLKGLYLAGGAAHPGPGMPMVLMSGWIAADALDRDGVAGPSPPSRQPAGAPRGAFYSGAVWPALNLEDHVRDDVAGTAKVSGDPIPLWHERIFRRFHGVFSAVALAQLSLPRVIARAFKPGRLLPRWFARHSRRYIRRHFHAVPFAAGMPPPSRAASAVVYLNHAAWWDPLIALHLATHFWPGRKHFARSMPRRWPSTGSSPGLGFFPVEQAPAGEPGNSSNRSHIAILNDPAAVLWITPQGRFTDSSSAGSIAAGAVAFAPANAGRGHRPARLIEYPFWQEKLPEALCRFGPILSMAEAAGDRRGAGQNQDALAALAIAQDPRAFHPLLRGRAGVGGIYDAWCRIRASLAGRRFYPGHGGEPA